MNLTAEKLLKSTSALKITNNKQLTPTDREAAAEFARAIEYSAEGQTASLESPLTIASPDERSPGLITTLLPLEKSKLADLCGKPNASLAVFVQDFSTSAPNAASAIAKDYGLTPSELRVLEVLSANGSVKDLAALLNVGETTIKTHLQHIFQKTGTHKRSELLELVTKSAPPVTFS